MATNRRSCFRKWRSSPSLAGSSRRRRRRRLERSAQEQVERLAAPLFESRPQVNRADRRIEAQEDTRVFPRAAEARVTALLPDIPRFQRQPDVNRHVEEPRTPAPDLPIEQQPRDAEVRPDERV